MKKNILKIINFVMLLLFVLTSISMASGNSYSNTISQKLKKIIESKDNNIEVTVEKSIPSKEIAGFAYVLLKIHPKGNKELSQELFVLSNGKYIIPALIDIDKDLNMLDLVKIDINKIQFNPDKNKLELGNADAKVKIVMFSDFECPFCRQAFPFIKNLAQKYNKQVAVYHYNFPLNFHKHARNLAIVYEAGKELGLNLADVLYSMKLDNIKSIDDILNNLKDKIPAPKYGKLKDLVKKSNKYNKIIESDMKVGSDLGVKGTPFFIINGSIISGFNPNLIKIAVDKYVKSK
ncbi:conserved hypothetical protein (plasmid) [Deferribacter desulfuricans SSM1]|uniref:Thioredoxin-like fold domain-containing protein n=1 Tax=Deferribacter desulfuricans (strain DSM 14783 / JCM 11476 / NBRC 101012 / SSM1) TaxID=639282 RepID=D3PEP3_DEFDS|nr:DsbA family protein [Deferribacter desulfuricans]BAI81685.1 conserved hypothetical protein [Deferribacter desulfuricans SSM1]